MTVIRLIAAVIVSLMFTRVAYSSEWFTIDGTFSCTNALTLPDGTKVPVSPALAMRTFDDQGIKYTTMETHDDNTNEIATVLITKQGENIPMIFFRDKGHCERFTTLMKNEAESQKRQRAKELEKYE